LSLVVAIKEPHGLTIRAGSGLKEAAAFVPATIPLQIPKLLDLIIPIIFLVAILKQAK